MFRYDYSVLAYIPNKINNTHVETCKRNINEHCYVTFLLITNYTTVTNFLFNIFFSIQVIHIRILNHSFKKKENTLTETRRKISSRHYRYEA